MMQTHVSLLEVFNEMTRLREENMVLRDENEILRKREAAGLPPLTREVEVEIEAHELMNLTKDQVKTRATELIKSRIIWDGLQLGRYFDWGVYSPQRVLKVRAHVILDPALTAMHDVALAAVDPRDPKYHGR